MNDFGELDQKDLRILELEECISKFKEYDKKRKEYYSNVLIELGKLHSELIEFKETNDYYNKIKSLKSTKPIPFDDSINSPKYSFIGTAF